MDRFGTILGDRHTSVYRFHGCDVHWSMDRLDNGYDATSKTYRGNYGRNGRKEDARGRNETERDTETRAHTRDD